MQLNIYKLPSIDHIELDTKNLIYENTRPNKLIKYGYTELEINFPDEKINSVLQNLPHDKKLEILEIVRGFNLSKPMIGDYDLIEELLYDLPKLMSSQKTGTNAIISITEDYSEISIQTIYYISSFYESSTLYFPYSAPIATNCKIYLILSNLKKDINIPKNILGKKEYLHTLNLNVDQEFINIYQCFASNLLEAKYLFNKKLTESEYYEELVVQQKERLKLWMETFGDKKATD